MKRLIPRKVVEIPESDPVIAYKKLIKDMRSPYRHHRYEMGRTYRSNCFNHDWRNPASFVEGFFTMDGTCTDSWDGERLFEVAIWGKVMLINKLNIENEYMKILRELEFESNLKTR